MSDQKCPDCGAALKRVTYSRDDLEAIHLGFVIQGVADVDGKEPHIGCDRCGYRGNPGGRTYQTQHTKPGYQPGTENSDNPVIIQVLFDVVEAPEEYLWGWAEGLFEARLELVHRGHSEEEIEEYGYDQENWDAMPFHPTEYVFIQYDPQTMLVVGACIFYAHGRSQAFAYRLPNMPSWDTCLTTGDFDEVMKNFPRSAGLQTWTLKVDPDATGDAFWGDDTNLGSEIIDSMVAGMKVDPDLLQLRADQFEHFLTRPMWAFEPTVAFQLGPKSPGRK